MEQADDQPEPEADQALMDVKEEEVEADGDVDADAVDYDTGDQVNPAEGDDADFAAAPSATLQEEHAENQHGPAGLAEDNDPGRSAQSDMKEDGSVKILDLSSRIKKPADVSWYLEQERANDKGLYDFSEVNLAKCKLQGDSAREVARFCQKCPGLKILKLHHNSIDDDVVEEDLMHIFKHCPRLEEVHLSHNWLTEKSCWLMVGEAAKHLPKASPRPLWLRMEHNYYKDPMEIAQRCKEQWCEVPVCFREDGRRCTNRYCKNNARIHLPFMLDDNKDNKDGWKHGGRGGRGGQNGSWSPWRSERSGGERYKDSYGNGYTGDSYYAGNDYRGHDYRGNHKAPGYGSYSNSYDDATAGRGHAHHRTNAYGRAYVDRSHSYESREGRERDVRWRDSRSRSRTPPPHQPSRVRLTERFSPPARRAPSARSVRDVRVPSPPGPRRRQVQQVRRVPLPPRKAPTPPRPRQPRPVRARRPVTPEPPNYQRNRAPAPQAPLPRNLAQIRRPPSPPLRPKLPQKPEEPSSSYEYYSDDEYSYDEEPIPQGQSRDVKSVVVPLPKALPKGSVGRQVQKQPFQPKAAARRREPVAKGRPFQQNRRR